MLDNYVRGSAWIATPFASEELIKRNPDASNVAFTEEEKEKWANDAEEYMAFRKNMEREVSWAQDRGLCTSRKTSILTASPPQLNSVHAVTLQGSELQTGAMQAFREMSESPALL